ncbi:SH2 domain-containing adapter protein F-like isoform X2 [Polyodon spathula]|uniref:SH2 domain-containing adapter protein F-like isoform X2 n=1 Tax=Polyodon spathula TaxID=7913 RepID=UPI001B7DF945|nr:SH2 domain-containing adapter protein F-like isoform X2 [Polyodon spathula]
MAKWLKDYLSFGSRRVPPQPPKPDYTESELLKAYRAQKNLDFEDPYEESENKPRLDGGPAEPPTPSSPLKPGTLEMKFVSPKHRLIKVDSQDLSRGKILVSSSTAESKAEPAAVPLAPAPGGTDYSDPFDARSNQEEALCSENNGYMEPYEAQRVITELKKGGSSEHLKGGSLEGLKGGPSERLKGGSLEGLKGGWTRRGVQLYDTPYETQGYHSEPEPPGGELEGGPLPQDDERPADEYDQPWEWKKENISKAFAVQFEVGEWDRPPPLKERLHPPKQSPLCGGPKFRKGPRLEAAPLLGERVDPSLPLEQQVWYHGALSRSEAESLLTLCKESSYLVRNSETSRNDFSLSLRSSQGFMHMKFTRSKDNKYILGQNSPPFDSIPEVIHYYTTHKLPIKGAEHLSLLFPVQVQTL